MIKSGYGWLIGLGTQSAYGTALLNTKVAFNKIPERGGALPGAVKLANGMLMADLPRYARFNTEASKLAASGFNFEEIAGNKGAIMLTVLTGKQLNSSDDFKLLFTQPIITTPGINRIALVTTVGNLSGLLRQLQAQHITVEHIYDY